MVMGKVEMEVAGLVWCIDIRFFWFSLSAFFIPTVLGDILLFLFLLRYL